MRWLLCILIFPQDWTLSPDGQWKQLHASWLPLMRARYAERMAEFLSRHGEQIEIQFPDKNFSNFATTIKRKMVLSIEPVCWSAQKLSMSGQKISRFILFFLSCLSFNASSALNEECSHLLIQNRPLNKLQNLIKTNGSGKRKLVVAYGFTETELSTLPKTDSVVIVRLSPDNPAINERQVREIDFTRDGLVANGGVYILVIPNSKVEVEVAPRLLNFQSKAMSFFSMEYK